MDPAAWLLAALAALSPATADQVHALAVLDRLDQRRSEAFARGDPSELRGVYTATSTLLRRDAATIAAYAARGLELDGADLEVESLQVTSGDSARLRVGVIDQLSPVRVRTTEGAWHELPLDQSTERVIVLRHTPRGWRIAAAHRTGG